MKEKGIHDLFQLIFNKINENLNNNNYDLLSDIVLNKSLYFKETSNSHVWASPDTLKTSNLNRNTLFIYNYIRHKYSNTHNKDSYLRQFENLVKFFDVFMGFFTSFNLTEDCFFIMFDDFFNSYVNSFKHSDAEKSKEDMEAILGLIKEETSNIL
jgi:hypothetical protein